jgi:Ribbon-helix-helix protein, copG family
MVRTQIQLTDEQARNLRQRAKQQGISMSAMIRRCLDEGLEGGALDRSGRYARAARLLGRFPDREGATDLAAAHDRHLDEAF